MREQVTTYKCDGCGKSIGEAGLVSATLLTDRRMNGAPSSENEYDTLDLCRDCASYFIKYLVGYTRIPSIRKENLDKSHAAQVLDKARKYLGELK